MKRAYYSSTIKDFLKKDNDFILASMVRSHPFDLNDLTRDSWLNEIEILKEQLQNTDGYIMLEYSIPRMGKRADVILIINGIIYVLEFKNGLKEYQSNAINQVMDYALDLKNFHEESHKRIIVPVLVSTDAIYKENSFQKHSDDVFVPLLTNKDSIVNTINAVDKMCGTQQIFNYEIWENAAYKPTPTIVEAAQALFNSHNVEEITRNDAGAQNLSITLNEIKKIIEHSKSNNKKSIVFVTGVPGAGKTLVGLNLATELHNNGENEHAVFLSGNQPLVTVLQEALARDKVKRERKSGKKLSKDSAKREIKTFIQIIHHYRDEYVGNTEKPTERIAIFDESQRAWTKDEIASFMARKKGIKNFDYSEPEFLISTMDRLDDWAVIVCLVGGGQEINKGEAGMPEWFDSMKRRFKHWDIYSASNLDDSEYLRDQTWELLTEGLNITINNHLHLSTSIRSFRSENVSLFVKYMLDNNIDGARRIYAALKDKYPIVLTRNLSTAKYWVKHMARGNERYGLFASSNAARLKPCGVYYAKDRNSISPDNWFLNSKDDIRSSFFMESVASEFETQGLELDYSIVSWDADLRIENNRWHYYQMSNRLTPPNWSKIRSKNNITYLKNAYRVLLTRARQGFIIFIPEGDSLDLTRQPEFYDKTYRFLLNLGIEEI